MGQDRARTKECDQAQLHQTAFEWTTKPDFILTHSFICIIMACEHLLVPDWLHSVIWMGPLPLRHCHGHSFTFWPLNLHTPHPYLIPFVYCSTG